MSVQKTYMGRIFMKPLAKSRGQNAELYINIGWNTSGNQLFPPYDARLGMVCSEEQYNDLMNALREYMAENSFNMCCCVCAMIMAPYTLCISCCIAHACTSKYTEKLVQITQEKTKGFSYPWRLELMQAGGHQAMVPDQMAYDQHGQPLIVSNKHGTFAQWPPLGYNVIVILPMKAEEFAPQWIPATQPMQPMMMGMPQQVQPQSIPVAEAVVVQSPTPQQETMNEA